MKSACYPLALLLILSLSISAQELPPTGLTAPPHQDNKALETAPLQELPGTVTDQPPLQVELPPVDASILNPSPQQAATSVAPQTLQVKPGINELMPIAVGHLNRLVTPFDNPVVTTTSQATTSTKGKIVYVATADETPVTLYITPGDNQDIALSLTLIPKRIPAREIHLSLDQETYKRLMQWQRQTKDSSDKPTNQEQDYITTLKQLFRDLGLQKTPAGFSLRDPSQSEQIQCHQDRLRIHTGQLLEGQDLLIFVGVARNTGVVPIEFDERACASTQEEVLAVAAWPKVVLGPGESTELYVAVRRKDEAAIMVRPSLLNGRMP
jgi:conjugal transfer pilus assembly protein TraK